MGSRSLRIGWIVMLIMGVLFIGSAVMSLTGGTIGRAFEQMSGQSWESFVAANPAQTSDFVKGSMRVDGVATLAIAVLVITVTLFAYRKGQKWSWYSLMAVGIIFWVGFLIHEIIGGGPIQWVIAGLVLLIIALAVPAKAILTQKSS